MMRTKKLYRSDKNKIISGVFGGLGEYVNVDPVILRLIWIVVLVFTGFIPGIIAYFLAVVVIPKKI
jgi:phage shock protein C